MFLSEFTLRKSPDGAGGVDPAAKTLTPGPIVMPPPNSIAILFP